MKSSNNSRLKSLLDESYTRFDYRFNILPLDTQYSFLRVVRILIFLLAGIIWKSFY